MSTTEITTAAPAAPVTTGGAPPAPPPAVVSKETPPPAAAPAAAPPADTKPKVTGAQAAYRRAQARKNAPPSTTAEQAPAGNLAGGASTPATPAEAGTAAPPEKPATGAAQGDKPAAGSIVTAPQDWPQPLRERFEKLPDQEARGMVLDIQKDLQRGFTLAMNELAQERTAHKDLFTLHEKFPSDPKTVINELAKRANLEIFFERPLPEGEVPEFKTPAEMAKWVTEQATRTFRQEQQTAEQARETKAREERAVATLREEFTAAAKDIPDFDQHRHAVVEALAKAPGLSVQQAYRVATYDQVVALAKEGQTAKSELAALKAQNELDRKKATQPPMGLNGAQSAADDKHLSPGQRAAKRAQQKIAARQAGTAHA